MGPVSFKTPKSPAQAPEAMTTCSNAIESRHGSISPWDDVNFGGFFVSGFVGTTKNNGHEMLLQILLVFCKHKYTYMYCQNEV